MRYPASALIGGMVLFQCLSRMPPPVLFAGILPLALLLVRSRRTGWRIVACCGVGFLWAMWRADLVLGERLPAAQNGIVVSVTGAIVGSIEDRGVGTVFTLEPRTVTDLRGQTLTIGRLRLVSFVSGFTLDPGALCTLKVRLRKPYGVRSPGAFDRERWLYLERIAATGYVIEHRANRCVSQPRRSALRDLRRAIAAHIATQLGTGGDAAIVAALAVADRTNLTDIHRQVLRDSGTAHLLAISGLHISLVAGAAFLLCRWAVGLCTPPSRLWPAQHPAALAAIGAATVYAALAGFPVSAQRALIMLTCVMISLLCRRQALSLDTCIVALAAVGIWDPTAFLSASTWLSFGAVGWLLLINVLRGHASPLRRLLRLHVLLAFGMTPLVAILHQSVPLVSPLANLVAVPVVTLVIVPCVLLGIIVLPIAPSLAGFVWRAAAGVWQLLFAVLERLVEFAPPLALAGAPSSAAFVFALTGVLLLIVPIVQLRWILAGALLWTLWIPVVTAPAHGSVRVAVIDVGQGLAVVVRTHAHVLVYDTGPAAGDYSAGAAVVVPYLRSRGITAVDRLLVSHGDNDHAGGAAALIADLAVRSVWASAKDAVAGVAHRCRDGDRWQWDGVDFTVLHPGANDGASRNDASCVLKITTRHGAVLLPGDIEAAGEAALLARHRAKLAADLIVAPHHGSATSSTHAFVAAVRPRDVVIAAAFANRYGFPDRDVVARYVDGDARVWTTGVDGTLMFTIDGRHTPPRRFRYDAARYWHWLPR